MSKKFLVTGGAGFIGSAFIRYIIKNTDHYIFNIDKLSYASNLLNLKEVQKNTRYSFAKIDVSNAFKIRAILRSKLQLFSLKFKKLDDIKKKYIFITLHVQPEASIDVVGSKYSNQIEFIRNIANTTPDEYYILVKEHSHAIGNRENSFYKKLQQIRNVILLHPSESSRKAIQKSSLVISNTGTSSLEACILEIPSVTATSMFYNQAMIRKSFNPNEEKVSELLKEFKKMDKVNLMYHLEKIYEGSFKGNCGDFQTDPDVLNKSNIKNLEMSFDSIIKSL